MDTLTAAVSLPAPAHEVFDYLARIETVADHASLCRELQNVVARFSSEEEADAV